MHVRRADTLHVLGPAESCGVGAAIMVGGDGTRAKGGADERAEWALFARGQESRSRRSRHRIGCVEVDQDIQKLGLVTFWCKKEA